MINSKIVDAVPSCNITTDLARQIRSCTINKIKHENTMMDTFQWPREHSHCTGFSKQTSSEFLSCHVQQWESINSLLSSHHQNQRLARVLGTTPLLHPEKTLNEKRGENPISKRFEGFFMRQLVSQDTFTNQIYLSREPPVGLFKRNRTTTYSRQKLLPNMGLRISPLSHYCQHLLTYHQ